MQHAGGKMLADAAGGIGLITFNQPAKRNAMSIEMWEALSEILGQFAEEPAIRVVVLTGAGEKAFVSGADISQFEKLRANADAQSEYDRLASAGRQQLARFPKPVIARIRGFCLGGGLGIALQADFRIAAVDSQFGIPAARLGIAYGFEMVRTLVSLVGPAETRNILYTGGRIDAAEALRIGLVNRVVEPADLERTVEALAQQLAENAPLSIAASKLAVAAALQDPAERDLAGLANAARRCFDSADYREGRTAFMEKRRPRFTGS